MFHIPAVFLAWCLEIQTSVRLQLRITCFGQLWASVGNQNQTNVLGLILGCN